jgi:N-acetylmuramoyl-L-alanine amidase
VKNKIIVVVPVVLLLVLIIVFMRIRVAEEPEMTGARTETETEAETGADSEAEEEIEERETVSVEKPETERLSSTEIRISWEEPEHSEEVLSYIIRRCSRENGENSGEWKTVAEVGADEELSVTDRLKSSEPQQFSYRVDVKLKDDLNYVSACGASVLGSNIMICIDPGHYAAGTKITGEDSYDYIEGVFTLKTGLYLKQILKEKYGIDSYMTRESGEITLGGYSDRELDRGHISLRGKYAEEKNSTLFISLHTNANQDNANGYPTCLQPENITKSIVFINRVGMSSQNTIEVANAIGTSLTQTNAGLGLATADKFITVDAGSIREWTDAYNDSLDTGGTVCKRMTNGEDYYGVLRGASEVNIPGLIVEHGFHTVARMRRLAAEGDLAEAWADADAGGIAAGFGFIQ